MLGVGKAENIAVIVVKNSEPGIGRRTLARTPPVAAEPLKEEVTSAAPIATGKTGKTAAVRGSRIWAQPKSCAGGERTRSLHGTSGNSALSSSTRTTRGGIKNSNHFRPLPIRRLVPARWTQTA